MFVKDGSVSGGAPFDSPHRRAMLTSTAVNWTYPSSDVIVWLDAAPASKLLVVGAVRTREFPVTSTPIRFCQSTGSGAMRGSLNVSSGAASVEHASAKHAEIILVATC